MKSIVEQRGQVAFPEFNGERIYMEPFYKSQGLPSKLQRWQATVDAMLDGIETDLPIYLMVDQKQVRANEWHRRSGMHIDGYWVPSIHAHGGSCHNTDSNRGGHRTGGSHSTRKEDRGGPRTGGGHNFSGSHGHRISLHEWPTEAIILASNVQACRALSGEFEGPIGEGGDCSHLDLSCLKCMAFNANQVYAGNVTMLHESMPVPYDCARTVVRLNVPGWSPQ